MNHSIPDFNSQMDQQFLPSPKKPSIADDDIMELLWQNGQVVTQTQTNRHIRKSPPAKNTDDRKIPPELQNYNQYLFMQEHEMASYLHCPINGDDSPFDQTFTAEFLHPPPTATVNNNSTMQTLQRASQLTELRQNPMPVTVAHKRPPVPPPRRLEQVPPAPCTNFPYFARHGVRAEPGSSSILKTPVKESTVVDSCDTPAVQPAVVSETERSLTELTEGDTGVVAPSTTFEELGGSSSSEEAVLKVVEHERKRKGMEAEELEYQSEDVDFESAEGKKNVSGSSTKRSRAAEVHNLSERRRRDRINEKMKALQELIPQSNKSDKASMLDEAIEYLKALHLQVQRVQHMQMMSMGCGMVPMMFPGVQQYMPTIGMGMGMEMGINRPVMPFPNMLSSSTLPATAANLGPRFAMPPFHMPHVPTHDSSRIGAAVPTNNNVLTSVRTHDPYQQYLGPHQMQFQLMKNLPMGQLNVSEPSIIRPLDNPERRQSGDK